MKKLLFIIILFALLATSVVYASVANTHSTDLEDGLSQYWYIIDADQTGLDITGDITIEAWVKVESDPSVSFYVIAGKWRNNGAAWRQYSFQYISDGGLKLRFEVSSNGSANEGMAVAQTLTAGTWFHVAAAWDASAASTEFFVNGSSIGTATGAITATSDQPEVFAVGSNNHTAGGGSFFDGLIDDVRVWNDLRTEAEINTNKDNCDLSASEAGLVSWWLFNNDGTDEHTNGNDLSNANSATFVTDFPYVCEVVSAVTPIPSIIWFD